MIPEPEKPQAGEESAETRLLCDATLERAAMALDYRMRAMAPMLREAEERRNQGLAAALREGAENDRKAFDEIQEARTRLDNATSAAAEGRNL